MQKQLADAIAECNVANDQIKAAEQQAAAESAHRIRIEATAQDVQQQLSRQTAEANKAQQACKKLHERVRPQITPCQTWVTHKTRGYSKGDCIPSNTLSLAQFFPSIRCCLLSDSRRLTLLEKCSQRCKGGSHLEITTEAESNAVSFQAGDEQLT